jgi:hypothetical protein
MLFREGPGVWHTVHQVEWTEDVEGFVKRIEDRFVVGMLEFFGDGVTISILLLH